MAKSISVKKKPVKKKSIIKKKPVKSLKKPKKPIKNVKKAVKMPGKKPVKVPVKSELPSLPYNPSVNGIYIDGTTISSISGPVSFYYLRPKSIVYKEGNASYFPLIILFGDHHRSFEYMCDKCTCSYKYKTCCYELSDPSLLQKFDMMATPIYPVDFYTETSFLGTGKGFLGGVMEHLTTGDMTSCYHHRLKDTDFDKCPTKNIRWHAGDIRNASSSTSRLIGIKNKYDHNQYMYTSKKFREDKYIESQLEYLLRHMQMERRISPYDIEDFHPTLKNMDEFKKLLLSIIDDDGKRFNTKRFSRAFFEMMNKENSAIYKQIQKQTFKNFNNITLWADFYASSLDYFLSDVSKMNPSNLKKLIREMDLTNVNYFKELDALSFETLYEFALDLGLNLLDLYVIARIFKQPTHGKRSSLSFCFFGDSHIQNIQRLLLETGAYDLVIDRKNERGLRNASRCQQFNFSLNLSDDVFQHNKAIEQPGYVPNFLKIVENYKNDYIS